MKNFFWLLLKAAIFFLFFAFVVDNRHEAMPYFLPGQEVTVLMAVVILGSIAFWGFSDILVMLLPVRSICAAQCNMSDNKRLFRIQYAKSNHSPSVSIWRYSQQGWSGI